MARVPAGHPLSPQQKNVLKIFFSNLFAAQLQRTLTLSQASVKNGSVPCYHLRDSRFGCCCGLRCFPSPLAQRSSRAFSLQGPGSSCLLLVQLRYDYIDLKPICSYHSNFVILKSKASDQPNFESVPTMRRPFLRPTHEFHCFIMQVMPLLPSPSHL